MKMSIEDIKKDAELLYEITRKYVESLDKDVSMRKRRKVENYINSLVISLDKNIKENVKIIETISKSG